MPDRLCRIHLSPKLKTVLREKKMVFFELPHCLRAYVRKYRESADRSEITAFFLFGQKNPFGELFSEMTLKGSISFFFLQNLQNLKIQSQGHQWRP